MKKKYAIEIQAEKFLGEITRLVRDFRRFFFRIPHNKRDMEAYIIETLAWLLLGLALILRWGRF